MRPESLPAILEQLSCELDFDRLVQQFAGLIVDRAEAALCRIWIRRSGDSCDLCAVAAQCQDNSECLHLIASSGLPEDSNPRRCPIGVGTTGLVARAGASLISDNPATDPRFSEEHWIQHHGIQTCAVIPLTWQSRNMGVLGVYCRERLSDENYQQLAAFVRRASFFLAHAHAADLIRRRMEGMTHQVRALRDEIVGGLQVEQLIGTSPAARQLRENMQAAAGSRDPLLILGASGVGKELAARSIHAQGQKPAEPFFKIDCHHVPPTTIESGLFGLEPIAFACAEDNPGCLELARCGTVFLRHVERLPLFVQQKLREYLRTGRYSRTGGAELRQSTARIVASTTRDLSGMAAAGVFDTQLHTLLSQHVLRMPSLRERTADIPLLVKHYAERFSREYFKTFEGVDPAVVRRLAEYPWPGNDRELSQVMERAVLLSTGPVITVEPGFGAPVSEDACNGAVLTLETVERAHIMHALQRTRGIIQGPTGAASLLGLPPSTLRSRMAKLGIPRSPQR